MAKQLLFIVFFFASTSASIAQVTVNLDGPHVGHFFPENKLEWVEENPLFDAFFIGIQRMYYFKKEDDGLKLVRGIKFPFDAESSTSIDLKKATRTTNWRASYDFATDLDQDGRPDLLVWDDVANNLYGCLNQGGGTFGKAQLIYESKLEQPGFFLKDNGSGDRTLIITDDYRVKQIIDLNNYPELNNFKVKSLYKDTDVVGFVLDEDGSGLAFQRKGFGQEFGFSSIKKKKVKFANTFKLGNAPMLCDVNQDGFVDIISDLNESVYLIQGAQDSQVEEEQLLFTQEELKEQNPKVHDEYLEDWSFTLNDFNGDQRMDIMAQSEYLVFLIQQEDGSFKVSLQMDHPYDANQIWMGDIDSDGDSDILVDSYYGMNVLLNSEGRFETVQTFGESYIVANFLVDANGDGMKDVFYIARNNDVLYWYESEDGKYLKEKVFEW